jgi:hypothetical protein
MSPQTPHVKPYTFEFNAAAWARIGSLSQEEFSLLQRALERITQVATAAYPAAPPAGHVLDAHVAGLALRYVVDVQTQVVCLVSLERQPRRPVRAAAARR